MARQLMLEFANLLTEYLAVGVGSAVGAALSITVGRWVSNIYCKSVGIYTETVWLFNAIGLFAGWWLGAISGCWLVLLVIHHSDAYLTAILLAVLTPLGMWYFFHRIISQTEIEIGTLSFWQQMGGIILVLAVLAVLLTHLLSVTQLYKYILVG